MSTKICFLNFDLGGGEGLGPRSLHPVGCAPECRHKRTLLSHCSICTKVTRSAKLDGENLQDIIYVIFRYLINGRSGFAIY
jgi:hypothetical protein